MIETIETEKSAVEIFHWYIEQLPPEGQCACRWVKERLAVLASNSDIRDLFDQALSAGMLYALQHPEEICVIGSEKEIPHVLSTNPL